MNDTEFDILDELYFLQPFQHLQETLQIEEKILKKNLETLLQKEWVKCFASATEEVLNDQEINFETDYKKYYYLATKKGLLAHNGH
ncbi:MAG: hypothetical protein EAZ55_08470 [Cytophagales bacterium]|nr:MAG: hypothetical protein EAZ55_08470 [Cytophagales bacterium]